MFSSFHRRQVSRMPSSSRRRFMATLAAVVIPRSVLAAPLAALRAIREGPATHPTPRRGITAEHVLSAKQLDDRSVAKVFDMVREIPEVVDGIHCYCGCASRKSSYSLLSCFEEDGMAQHCHICQGEARLVHELHGKGVSLAGIRKSIDDKYADS
jgi:hypothetical protein